MSATHTSILERLEKATGPDRELDIDICRVDPDAEILLALARSGRDVPRYTVSLDSAIALVKRVKPGWNWYVGSHGRAAIDRKDPHSRFEGLSPTPAIALLLALFRSLSNGGGK